MQSVTRPGGSGFLTLSYQGQRLAYLQITEEKLPVPKTADVHSITGFSHTIITGYTKASVSCRVYEVWNQPVWKTIRDRYAGGGIITMVGCLQRALEAGNLTLTKTVKSPAGDIRLLDYDLHGAKIQELLDDPQGPVAVAGTPIAHTLRFTELTGHRTPSGLPTPSGARPPVSTSSEDVEVNREIDKQFARYALRSFRLEKGHLGSIAKTSNWNGGTAIAQCRATSNHCEVSPGKNCRCGLYGTLTLEQLIKEYKSDATKCVAVFAAEGKTMLGTRGLRTQAARIVAYWCASNLEKMVFDRHAPEATHFERIEDMLATYHFPAYDPHAGHHHFPDYVPNLVLPEPSKPFTAKITPHYGATAANAYQALAPNLTAATPGGISAVQYALGYSYPETPIGHSFPAQGPGLRCGHCGQLVASGCPCGQGKPPVKP